MASGGCIDNRLGCRRRQAERPAIHLNTCSHKRNKSLIRDPMSSASFEMVVSVLPEDIDEQNHVNNAVYLRWVQEVATAHWCAVTSSEAQEGIGWVVLRHEIDYKSPACLGDAVVLRTWVGKATRLTFG